MTIEQERPADDEVETAEVESTDEAAPEAPADDNA